jgi:dolichyl-phosphate-mannose-protein mannosyltransferase
MGEDAERVNYRVPGFFSKFFELNKVMWLTNAGLVESHTWDSRPGSWPWLRRGINFWYELIGLSHGRGKDHRQVYLIGNPIVWWSSSLAIAMYLIVKAVSILCWQRGLKDFNNGTRPPCPTNSSNLETL